LSGSRFTVWGRDRAPDLHHLVDLVLPAEGLSLDELVACCWDDPDPAVVLGGAAGDAAASVVVRDGLLGKTGWVRFLGVAPMVQGAGLGRELLAAAEAWAFDQGVETLGAGASAPFYLWPGVDVRWTRALCLFESAGWWTTGAEVNMSCPTTHRAAPPDGVEVRRALADVDAQGAVALAERRFPHWVAEVQRGIEHGACLVAADETGVLGFACHSVNRAAWVGPMATDPDRQRGGVGSALLAALCQDLRAAGFADAEIAWVGPVGFYAKAAGASVSRTFRSLAKRKP
jgi:mycothiol synthase